MKILLVDNFDSFTYNLYHQLNRFEEEVEVVRNDEIDFDDARRFDRIVLSPGPGLPREAGKMIDLIDRFKNEKKILGVCLGLQAIAEAEGAKLINLKNVLHGVAVPTQVQDTNEPLFTGLPRSFKTGRYHSWCVDPEGLPATFRITANDDFGGIMALTHENQLLRGVQFHPESILTEYGNELIYNWLYRC